MQCFLCKQGTLWADKESFTRLAEEGFFKQIRCKQNPEKIHYFYICGACLEGCRELLKELLQDTKEEYSCRFDGKT